MKQMHQYLWHPKKVAIISDMKRSFTLIELIFVIIVIGVLAAVALPKFTEALNQADIGKAKSTVTAIRSGLQVYKNKHILLGESPYPSSLDSGSGKLFDVVLPDGITPSTDNGGWSKSNDYYIYHTPEGDIAFEYNSTQGSFSCVSGAPTTIDGICNSF